jgi:hypothetical protein
MNEFRRLHVSTRLVYLLIGVLFRALLAIVGGKIRPASKRQHNQPATKFSSARVSIHYDLPKQASVCRDEPEGRQVSASNKDTVVIARSHAILDIGILTWHFRSPQLE